MSLPGGGDEQSFDSDFYEDDEPVSEIQAIWEQGVKGVTAPPERAEPLAGYEGQLRLVVRGEVVSGDRPVLYQIAGEHLNTWAPVDVPHVDVTEHLPDGTVRRTLWGLP